MSCKQHFTVRKLPKDQKNNSVLCVAIYIGKVGCFQLLEQPAESRYFALYPSHCAFHRKFSLDLSAIIVCHTLEAAQPCLSLCRYRKRACIVQSWQHGRVCSTSLQITSGCYRQVGWMIRFISSTAHRKITLKLAWFKQTNKHKNTHYAQEVSVSQLLLRAYLHLIFTDRSY